MREQLAQQPPPVPTKRRASLPTPAPANPHHAGFHAGLHPEDRPEQSGPFGSSYGVDTEEDDDEGQEQDIGDVSYYQQRLPTSTVRYRSTTTSDQQASSSLVRQGSRQLIVHYGQVPRRASRSPQQSSATSTGTHTCSHRRSLHPLFYLGLGMFIMVLGWFLFSTVGTWALSEQNTWRYGYPRVDQLDAVVGHHDSARHPTHLVALNSVASRATAGTINNWTKSVPNGTNVRKSLGDTSISRWYTNVSPSASDVNARTVCIKRLILSHTDWLKGLW